MSERLAMDSVGGFHEVETDGKLFLVYHSPKHNLISQTQSSTSLNDAIEDDLLTQTLFLCPWDRLKDEISKTSIADRDIIMCSSFPEYVISERNPNHHSVLPLFWCNNKEFDADRGCYACKGSKYGTNYYFCDDTKRTFHKECVESQPKIKHPYHPQHFLQLYFYLFNTPGRECFCCGNPAIWRLVYHCTICDVFMHTVCAMKTISFVINTPKSHHHPLTLFPRQTSLTCNVCGLLRKNNPTYVCLRCNYVAHDDCMYSPHVIKISRHPQHRVSYVSSLPLEEWSCGVCRKSIVGDEYGAYICKKCGDYAVHPRFALRKDVCDGKELEGVHEAEEDDITKDEDPFSIISEGVIFHFLHDHYLRLEVSMFFDENKLCQMCYLPIYEGNFYSCKECDFTVHESCAKSRRRIQHALHPHPLTLKLLCGYEEVFFDCNTCSRSSNRFVYQCPIKSCSYDLDLQCASIFEPFVYQGHEHPLFMSLDPGDKPICEVCKKPCKKQLNCIECDFIICFSCVTLPYKASYTHEKHFLTLLWAKEVCEKDWCEVCERNFKDTSTKSFYWCNECCTSLHIECLFGKDMYMQPGQVLDLEGKEVQILRKSNMSRAVLCEICKDRCKGKIFKIDSLITCSVKCSYAMFGFEV